jgi:ribokinase
MTNESKMSVFVAGSINMDIVANCQAIPVPGETVSGSALQYFPGGKGANQAVASAKAKSHTMMIGGVGTDTFSEPLLKALKSNEVDTANVSSISGESGVALIIVQNDGNNSIVVVPGANGKLLASQLDSVDFSACAVGVSQFEIPVPVIETFFTKCRKNSATTVLNAAPAILEIGKTFELSDILIFNETELSAYSEFEISDKSTVDEIVAAAKIVRFNSSQKIVVTLGSRGLVALDNERIIEIDGHPVKVVDTTGAGDCFVGYLASQIAQGYDFELALTTANRASSISVQIAGATPSIPKLTEVTEQER